MTAALRPLLAIGSCAVSIALVCLHAGWRRELRERETPAIIAVARFMPGADLALAGAARHLRFPSLEEPGAAFADAPASPDTDPGGGALAPPVELYQQAVAPRGSSLSVVPPSRAR
jgi:hypothetical protein